MMASDRMGSMPPRVQSAPSLLPSDDGLDDIFTNMSYRNFLHHEPAIAEEGEPPAPSAAELARKRGCVVVVTGPTDYVTDGAVTLALSGGEAMVQQVTGSGCALSALVVAFVACAAADGEGDGLGRLGYAAACCAFYKAAAARAGGDGCPGPGTLKVKLMDALAMDRDAVAAAVEASVSVKVVVTPGFQLSG